MWLFGKKSKKDKNADENAKYQLKIDAPEDQKIIDVRTDKDRQTVKYEGMNEEMFEKYSVDNLREDARVVVPPTHAAIILRDGALMNTLDSGIYDIFEKKQDGGRKNYEREATVDVIFVSKTARLQVRWGTRNQFQFRDIETNVPVQVGANGEFEVGVDNARKFYLELVGADRQFSVTRLKDRLIARVVSVIEPVIAKTMREKNLSYDRLTENKLEIASAIKPELSKMFVEDYGLKVYSFTLSEVVIADQYIEAIEKAREEKEERTRQEELEAKAEEKFDKYDNINWERQREMRDYSGQMYDKYTDAVKTVGHFEGEGTNDNSKNGNFGNNNSNVGAGQFCKYCGKAIEKGTNFCPHCGNKL